MSTSRQWGSVSLKTSVHSGDRGDPSAPRSGGEFVCAPNGIVGSVGCPGQYEVGLDGRLCLMLHLTAEHPLRPLQRRVHQLQAFQGVGPITIPLGRGLLSSLELMAVLPQVDAHSVGRISARGR